MTRVREPTGIGHRAPQPLHILWPRAEHVNTIHTQSPELEAPEIKIKGRTWKIPFRLKDSILKPLVIYEGASRVA